MYIDFADSTLHYAETKIPLEIFGITQETLIVNLYYNLKATYQKPNGRFNLIFSNSAIIDCHYIFGAFIDSLKVALLPYKD